MKKVPDTISSIYIGEYTHREGFVMDFHVHPRIEIGLVLGGQGHYDIKSRKGIQSLPAHAGMALVWDGTRPHRAVDVPGHPLRQIILTFPPALLGDWPLFKDLRRKLRLKQPIVLTSAPSIHRLKELLRRLMGEQHQPATGSSDLMMGYIREILILFMRSQTRVSHSAPRSDPRKRELPTATSPRGAPDPRITSVLEHLATHYSEPMGTTEISSRVGLSRRQFQSLFKAATGANFATALVDRRMEAARDLLSRTDWPVTRIAFQVGFDQLPYFTRLFKRKYGVSPLDFRRKHGSQP